MRIDVADGFKLLGVDDLNITGCGSYIYWRYCGEQMWRKDKFDLVWDGLQLTGYAHDFKMSANWIRECDNIYIRHGTLSYHGSRSVEIARLNDIEGEISSQALLYTMTPLPNGSCCAAQGEHLPPQRSYNEELWASMHVFWPQLSEPIADMPDVACTNDIGLLATSLDSAGLVFCYTGPGLSMGEIGLFTQRCGFYTGMPLDGILMECGDSRELEHLALLHMKMGEALNWWAHRCAQETGTLCRLKSFAGYCSWYHEANRIMPDTVRHAADGMAKWPRAHDGCTVQIDDGYQKMPGDWRGNMDWADALPQMPAQIEALGLVPGLWMAPHAVSERHPLWKEHPEYFQRLPDGSPAISFSNWGWTESDRATWRFSKSPGGQTYFFDPDVPEAQDFMRQQLQDKYAEGWRYFKLDFTYALSNARKKYDPKKTGFETLNGMWRLFRETLGKDALINACIGANYRWALGSADIARIGGDMGSDSERLASSVRQMTQNVCTNGKWWLVDPDVFYMSAAHSKGGAEVNYLLAGTARLMGGVFITSDLPEWWNETECELLRALWPDPTAAAPLRHTLVTSDDGLPQTLLARFSDHALLGVYNWSDSACCIEVDTGKAGLMPNECLISIRSDYAQPARISGKWLMPLQPPVSLRIMKVVCE